MVKKKLLIITSLDDLEDIYNNLKKNFLIDYKKNITKSEISKIIHRYHCIFTNPNNSKIYFGKLLLNKAKKLEAICTASTGTTHIDLNEIKIQNIKLISLKDKRREINKITSTSEHALGLTLNSLRMIYNSYADVLNNNWNFEKFIGRQLNCLNFGILGYGRLGKNFSKYIHAIGGKVNIYDPYKTKINKNYKKYNNLKMFLKKIDVLSIHVHYNKETHKFVNINMFKYMKKSILIVNTSRGEVVNENDLINFLKKNKNSKYATDVLTDEINFKDNKLFKLSKKYSNKVFITPHIGGMTFEGRKIAYNKASKDLINVFKN